MLLAAAGAVVQLVVPNAPGADGPAGAGPPGPRERLARADSESAVSPDESDSDSGYRCGLIAA